MTRTNRTIVSIIARSAAASCLLATLCVPASAQKILAVYKVQSGSPLEPTRTGYLAICQSVRGYNSYDIDLKCGEMTIDGSFRYVSNSSLAPVFPYGSGNFDYAAVGKGKMGDGHLRIVSKYTSNLSGPNYFFCNQTDMAFGTVGDCWIRTGQVVIDLSLNQQTLKGSITVGGPADNNFFKKTYLMMNNFIGVRIR